MHQSFIRHFLHRAITFVLMVSCAATVLAAPKPGGRATPVMVDTARLIRMAPQIWVAGTVISRHQARLATEVAGKLVRVAEVGKQVAEGDVVAKIDSTFVKLKIEESQAAVERDRARLDFLKAEMQRLKRLAKQSNASQTLLDRTRADREVARNELSISRTRLKQAREEKRRHLIRAPFDGVVVGRLMRRGERAGVGDEVLELIDSRTMEIRARVPLATLDFLKEGDLLNLKANGVEKQSAVRALVSAGDDRSGLLELRLTLSGNEWTIGQPVRIALPTAVAKEVLAIPRDALVLRRDGAAVFRVVIDENGVNKAERISVRLGVASGSLVEVMGNIQAGDRVITRGGERLRPGAQVKVLDDGAAGNGRDKNRTSDSNGK